MRSQQRALPAAAKIYHGASTDVKADLNKSAQPAIIIKEEAAAYRTPVCLYVHAAALHLIEEACAGTFFIFFRVSDIVVFFICILLKCRFTVLYSANRLYMSSEKKRRQVYRREPQDSRRFRRRREAI